MAARVLEELSASGRLGLPAPEGAHVRGERRQLGRRGGRRRHHRERRRTEVRGPRRIRDEAAHPVGGHEVLEVGCARSADAVLALVTGLTLAQKEVRAARARGVHVEQVGTAGRNAQRREGHGVVRAPLGRRFLDADRRILRVAKHRVEREEPDGSAQTRGRQQVTPAPARRAHRAAIDERQREQEPDRDEHEDEHERAFPPARDDLEELEQPQEVPLGSGEIVRRRIRGRVERGAVLLDDDPRETAEQEEREHEVVRDLRGPERRGLRVELRLRPRPARLRAVPPEEVDVRDEERDQQHRQEEDVEPEEARERQVPDAVAALHHALDPATDERDGPHDAGHDAGRPVALLIPGQEVAGQAERERHEQQEHAGPPAELSRRAVGAVQQHLEHVHDEQDDHRARAEVVQAAHEPAERHHVAEEVDASPRLPARRRVVERHQHAGHGLQHEQEEQPAAEDVGPARTAEHGLVERGLHDLPVAGAVLEPVAKLHQTSRLAEVPETKRRYVTSTVPSGLTSTGSESSPRGEGPPSTWPSASAKSLVWQGQANTERAGS